MEPAGTGACPRSAAVLSQRLLALEVVFSWLSSGGMLLARSPPGVQSSLCPGDVGKAAHYGVGQDIPGSPLWDR